MVALCAPLAFAQAPAKGALSWEALGMVGIVKKQDKFVPEFPKDVAALDAKLVKLQGFMVPLDVGAAQKRFLLSAQPSECAYCLPAGPDQLVEVQVKSAFKYTQDAVTVTGKLALLRDDPAGMLYRITEAVATDK